MITKVAPFCQKLLEGGQFGIYFCLLYLMVEKYSFKTPLCICTLTHGGKSILIDPLMGQKIDSFYF